MLVTEFQKQKRQLIELPFLIVFVEINPFLQHVK